MMSIILISLQLFNFQMRTLTTSKFISLTSSSHGKVKGNPFIGGIVLFWRIAPEAGDSVSPALRRAPPGKLEAECAGRGRGQGWGHGLEEPGHTGPGEHQQPRLRTAGPQHGPPGHRKPHRPLHRRPGEFINYCKMYIFSTIFIIFKDIFSYFPHIFLYFSRSHTPPPPSSHCASPRSRRSSPRPLTSQYGSTASR